MAHFGDIELTELNIALAEFMCEVFGRVRETDAEWEAHDDLTHAVANVIEDFIVQHPATED